LGIDNVSSDYALPQGTLRDAVNVDITLAGHPRRCKGRTKRYSGLVHSLYSDGRSIYGVAGGNLAFFTRTPDGSLTPTTIRSAVFPASRKLAWLQFKSPLDRDRVYYSNGLTTGMLVNRVHYPWGVESPSGQPALTATTDGGLDAGIYQVAVTFVSLFGEESGTGESAQVAVVQGGGIVVSKIPQPAEASVTRINLYVSEANGAIPFLYATLPVARTSGIITRSLSLGRRLETRFMRPPPAGEVIELHRGRIWIAAGPVLYFTESLWPGLYRSANSLVLPADIALLAHTEAGLIVAADRTYLLEGADPRQMQIVERLPYGAYKGTLVRDERRRVLYWLSPKGLVMAGDDGSIRNLSQGRLVLRRAAVGTALLREANGLRQLIGVLHGGLADELEATDFRAVAAL